MSTRIGCDNLVYAIQTNEDTPLIAPVYGLPKSAPGVMSVNINPNASLETLFADDGPMESASTLGKIEVEIKKNELTTENKADLLGHSIDSNGGVLYGDSDVPPYVAIGFRSLKSNGKYRYVWLYKGKFSEPEDQNETKGDSINFQPDTIKGQFVKMNYPTVVNGANKRLWKYDLDGDYAGASEAVMSTWFDTVKMPSNIATPTLTVAFAAGTVSGSTKATITETAGAGNHFAYAVADSPQATPAVGTTVSGATTYVSGNNITGVTAGKSVAIYELTTGNKVVKFITHVLLSGEIGV